jgi:aminopeptidase N
MRIEYLNRRTNRDKPLIRVSGQSNLIYRKGALVMYALREYIGEDRVNQALRNLLQKHGSGDPPYPVSLDLLEELRAVTPDSLQYLLTDFFEENTLWELRTNNVQAEPTGTGEWRVTLEVEAYKLRGDSLGDHRVPMDDFIEVGIFTEENTNQETEPLYLQMHRLKSGRQTITVTVPKMPAVAGLDPYNKLVERKWTDNTLKLKAGEN